MHPERCRLIAALLAAYGYTAVDGKADSPEYARLTGRRLTGARVIQASLTAIEMTFEGIDEPDFIAGDFCIVNADGTVQFGGWNSEFPLLFRLTPDPAKSDEAAEAAQDINRQYSRVGWY